MRKIIRKKKKKMKGYQWHRSIERVLSTAAVVCILVGTILPAHGNEKIDKGIQASREVVTEIYHKHEGSKGEQGGCFAVPVVHQHQGDEISGGPCYQTPVYHSHQGNASESGGCYTQPVTHEHQGDEQQGGACYEEITHAHVVECYQQQDCLMTHTPDGNILETWPDTCFSHGQVTFGKSQGVAVHHDCDKGQEERTYRYCLTCGSVSPSIHSYQELICTIDEGTITGYQRNCGKDETTIDGYTTGCGLAESEIEGYLLSCEKTIEEYEADCGFLENQLCGRLIVTNEITEQTEETTIHVRLEDLTGGSLKLSAPPYEWRDESGRVIGSGDTITVNENGTYSVTCRLENKDVDEAGLHSSITIDNIYQVKPGKSPSPGQTSAVEASSPPEDEKHSSSDDGSNELETVIPTPRASIAPEPVENTKEDTKSVSPVVKTKKASVQEKFSLSPSQEKAPVFKESQTSKMEEYEASNEAVPIKEEKKRTGFFDTPAAKMITVAGSVLALVFVILFLLFYLRQSVKVLNDDGEGRMICLGRCMVKTKNDCYRIVIIESMEEKACTNRYCIRPGLFRLGKKEGEELVIVKGRKSVTACLDKEMIVML